MDLGVMDMTDCGYVSTPERHSKIDHATHEHEIQALECAVVHMFIPACIPGDVSVLILALIS